MEINVFDRVAIAGHPSYIIRARFNGEWSRLVQDYLRLFVRLRTPVNQALRSSLEIDALD